MDDEEEYLPLVQFTLANFDIQEDLDKWDSIQEKVRTIRETRQHKLDEMQHSLRTLSRKLELAKSRVQESQKQAAGSKAADEIKQLDKDKYSLAKSINELEQSNASSLATIDDLQQELQLLENEDVFEENTSDIDDATILKLRMYRSLGISLENEKDGVPTRALIQSSTTGNAQIFDIDNKYSSTFVTNYLWERL